MLFAANAESIFAARVQSAAQNHFLPKGLPVQPQRLFGYIEHIHAFDIGRGTGKVFVDKPFLQAYRFEYLRAGVGHIGRDAHFGHHLAQPLADCLGEILRIFFGHGRVAIGEFREGFHCQVRMHGFGPVTAEQGKVMRFASRAGFDDQAGTRAHAVFHQVMMHGGCRQQRRDGQVVCRHLAVRNNQNVGAGTHGIFRLCGKRCKARLDPFLAP